MSVGRLARREPASFPYAPRVRTTARTRRGDAGPRPRRAQRASGRLDPVKKVGTIGSVTSADAAAPEPDWAERVSRQLLEPLGARWRHTVGVGKRARLAGRALEPGEADVLVAAAYLHDVGYAPELSQTGFHPVDGARFAREAGHERLAGLVAYHSRAREEADQRGLADELSAFDDERSIVSQALTYCDLTTDSEGRPVEPEARLEEIRGRYGASAPEVRALERSSRALLDDVRAVEELLATKGLLDLVTPATDAERP